MIETLQWVINTPGIGGIIILVVLTIALIIYASALIWLRSAAQVSAPTSEMTNQPDMSSRTEPIEGEAKGSDQAVEGPDGSKSNDA